MDDRLSLVTDYNTLMSKYAKLCDFLKRVEDGSSPIHDDYPVSGLYEQQKQMQKELSELKTRLKALGVEV